MNSLKPIFRTLLRLAVISMMLASSVPLQQASAQAADERRPVDMMLVIDNSCSMFPEDKIVPGCEVWGNDPDFLRIDGADLFIARLGFAEANEAEYQAGVISLGKTPKILAELQPLTGARDAIAKRIAGPTPELGTHMVDALTLAFRELRTSPNRRSNNLPAVVLLTDGRPYPLAGQSDAEIEQLVSENSDIPLFIMLLQDPTDPEYERYIRFWEQMQTRYDHVFSYRIEEQGQIEESYNKIIAQLQNTIPAGPGISVDSTTPYEVFVSRYVHKIIITVMHEAGEAKGNVRVEDPKGVEVTESDAGVQRFRGVDNPVEVISISAPRLQDDMKEDVWTITSEVPVTVFLDRQGAYRLNFLEPVVSLTDVTNVYLATERHTPSREFTVQFNLLVEKSDQVVVEAQPIQGEIIYPDGSNEALRIPSDLKPDANGMYEFNIDFGARYPPVLDEAGRFILILNAGSADDRATERIPIARAQLRVDVGRGPYIERISPDPWICASDQTLDITVNVGDYELASPDTVRVRVFSEGNEVTLEASSPGVFSANLDTLCAPLISALDCSTQQESVLRLRLIAQLQDGTPLPSVERTVPVQILAPPCPPTPTVTPSPTPTPTPTPIPDSDHDGFKDPVDECPTEPGIAQFNGCPIPVWLWALIGVLGLGLLALVVFYIIPWISVRVSPPPKGYVLVCRAGRTEKGPLSTYSVGMSRRKRKITIGGNRKKAHIFVRDLKPVEFYVAQSGDTIKIFDAERGAMRATLREFPSDVTTSASDVKLRVGLDASKLRC